MAANESRPTTALFVTVVLGLASLVLRMLVFHFSSALLVWKFGAFEFGIRQEWNQNWAFSIPLPQELIIAISVTVLLLLLMAYTKNFFQGGLLAELSFGAIMGGALYNLLERIFSGAVLDYLVLGVGGAVGTWNSADFFVILGIIGLILAERSGKYAD